MKCISVPHIQMEAGVSNSILPVFSAQHVERFVGGEESYLFVVTQVKQFPSSCLGLCAASREICNLQDGAPVKLSPVEWLTALSAGGDRLWQHIHHCVRQESLSFNADPVDFLDNCQICPQTPRDIWIQAVATRLVCGYSAAVTPWWRVLQGGPVPVLGP